MAETKKPAATAKMQERTYGVLTGDIVASSEFPPEVRAGIPDLLRKVGQELGDAFTGAIPFPIAIFRGDSWQLLIVRPEQTLRVALDARCRLHSLGQPDPITTRIGIGIGGIDFVPEHSVSEGDGPAFRLSGQALEEMDRYRHTAIRFADALSSSESEAIRVIVTTVDAIANRWTMKQSMAVSGALRGLTQEEIGSGWQPNPISQQAVAQHLENAGWTAISESLEYVERVVGQWADRATEAAGADQSGDPESGRLTSQ